MSTPIYKPSLLLIECDANIGLIFQKYFESWGFLLELAYNSEIGIKKALSNKYDLIIIDLENPKRECFEALNKIREINDNICIIAIGSKRKDENEINTYKNGGNLYHPKPINFVLLLEEINQLLQYKRRSSLIKMLDLQIDTTKRIVKRKNLEIKLTCNEFNFLLLLIEKGGEVLTRQKIIGTLLDYNKDIQYGAVDTMISRTRKKLSISGKMTVIDTVMKVGYRLNQKYWNDCRITSYK